MFVIVVMVMLLAHIDDPEEQGLRKEIMSSVLNIWGLEFYLRHSNYVEQTTGLIDLKGEVWLKTSLVVWFYLSLKQ